MGERSLRAGPESAGGADRDAIVRAVKPAAWIRNPAMQFPGIEVAARYLDSWPACRNRAEKAPPAMPSLPANPPPEDQWEILSATQQRRG
ncbi:MAG: hypothetical protein JXP34_00350, partial [Planctomycetes bacterium]|nr:hypothetical protein [Planctomycetota bacterium]